jgi:hypothetical protein
MRNNCVKIGMKVMTATVSGELVSCTVLEQCTLDVRQWVLASPSHGYAIQRHHREFTAIADEKKEIERSIGKA